MWCLIVRQRRLRSSTDLWYGVDGGGPGKVASCSSVPCNKQGAGIAWSLDAFPSISSKAVSRCSAPLSNVSRGVSERMA